MLAILVSDQLHPGTVERIPNPGKGCVQDRSFGTRVTLVPRSWDNGTADASRKPGELWKLSDAKPTPQVQGRLLRPSAQGRRPGARVGLLRQCRRQGLGRLCGPAALPCVLAAVDPVQQWYYSSITGGGRMRSCRSASPRPCLSPGCRSPAPTQEGRGI